MLGDGDGDGYPSEAGGKAVCRDHHDGDAAHGIKEQILRNEGNN